MESVRGVLEGWAESGEVERGVEVEVEMELVGGGAAGGGSCRDIGRKREVKSERREWGMMRFTRGMREGSDNGGDGARGMESAEEEGGIGA